ncbi:MAG: 3-hydroxybutyrate dehydrogenase [Rickettsiaceae bacterium]|nr:MAG: 3-hydroxybutyrate dehydrogenase [Rickettsiaceae bacterium]
MENKIVVITGSTSGIGLGLARKFAENRACLVINGIATAKSIIDITAELKTLGAKEVFFSAANLAEPKQIELMFNDIIQKFGTIDVLINNAGIQFVSAIEDFPIEKWELITRINLIASFYTMKYTIPFMKRKSWGRIINMASAHALVASPLKSAYVAAKHGLLGLTKTAALELAEHNITVNAICPGYVDTPLVTGQLADTARLKNISTQEVIEQILLKSQATKKFIQVDEVAALALFLCQEEAKSITGASMTIDGGWTAA